MTIQTEPAGTLTIDRVRELFAFARFHCIDLATSELRYPVPVGMYGWVAVIGHPDHGSYEWVAILDRDYDDDPALSLLWSNQGYGSAAAALRDGLIETVDS